MRKRSLLIALLLVSSIAAARVPPVQEVQAGNWTGTISEDGDQSIDVVYEVKTDDGLAITIHFTGRDRTFPTSNAKLEDTILTFNVIVGNNELTCALAREDGSFYGECVAPTGDSAYLVMNPPERT